MVVILICAFLCCTYMNWHGYYVFIQEAISGLLTSSNILPGCRESGFLGEIVSVCGGRPC